jgi:hypothetical protein
MVSTTGKSLINLEMVYMEIKKLNNRIKVFKE